MSRATLLLAAALVSGCTAVPPGPLEADERWKDLMRFDAPFPNGSTLYVRGPRLEQPEVELSEGTRVTFEDKNHSRLVPEALPGAFVKELRETIKKGAGFETTVWEDDGQPGTCDFELRLTVTRYSLELVEVGMASSMASLWPFGLIHLASFYNAPDETYRCEYVLRAELRDGRRDVALRSRTIRASKEVALTDFQRGWTLYSYWPQESLGLGQQGDLEAWEAYSAGVVAACEPHARREVLIGLMRFLRDAPENFESDPAPAPFALVLGVNQSRRSKLSTNTAEADAAAVAKALPGSRLLVGEAASSDEAQRLLWEQVARVSEGDTLVVYFAGCGTLREQDSDLALLLADRACPLDRLLEPLRVAEGRGARPIVILDAGFFGGSRCEGDPKASADALAALEERADGVLVWLADEGEAGALEQAANPGGGLLTKALLEGIASGERTVADLARHVEAALLRKSYGKQQARLIGPEDRSLVLPTSAAR